MADIGWIVTYDGQSGGNWVRRRIVEGLADDHDVGEVVIEPQLSPGSFLPAMWRLATYDRPDVDLWVEDVTSLAVRLPTRRTENVLVLHHLPVLDRYRSLGEILGRVKTELVVRRAREADRVVVVSDYWADFLARHGVEGVETIYNGLPVSEFAFEEEAVAARRTELCDGDEPLIHVGPCAPLKGGKRVARRLSEWDATLITTGRSAGDAPVRHLDLPYDEYLETLAACDALVAMSEFPEGWGLQVQEAMLCRTPVVGSGRGGMRMLLEGGDQIVCEQFADLEDCVREALANGDRLGERGYEYASQFTLDRMVESWRAFFDQVTSEA